MVRSRKQLPPTPELVDRPADSDHDSGSQAEAITGSSVLHDAALELSAKDWWKSGYELYNGVFEGGGAKGLAYMGALGAVRDRGVWFHRVAGASVGSIVAALVASGLTVEQFRAALYKVRGTFGSVRGFRTYARLRQKAGVLDPTKLREFLESVLVAQVETQTGAARTADGGAVTFQELFEATEIELNVVAIDIFDRREVIFNYISTPQCQVVDAVLASSAIPGFFPPGRLCVPRSDTVTLAHPIVDGGVWANFPLFVFREDRFRTFHGLPPLTTSADRRLMGFLLEESQLVTTSERMSRYATPLRTSHFWCQADAVLPAELTLLTDDETINHLAQLPTKPNFKLRDLEVAARSAVSSRWEFLNPTTSLKYISQSVSDRPTESWNSTAELKWLSVVPGRRSRIMRSLTRTSQVLRSLVGAAIVLIAVGTFALGAWSVSQFVRGDNLGTIGLYGVPYLLLLIPSFVIVVLGVTWLLLGNIVFGRAAERYGYLVGSTLAAAGAVRYWMDGDETADPDTGRPLTTIVRVPVPDDLTTLNFEYVNVNYAIDLARADVGDQLDAMGFRVDRAMD